MATTNSGTNPGPGSATPTEQDEPEDEVSSQIHETEVDLLNELREMRRKLRREKNLPEPCATTGQRIADGVAKVMGSWTFIIVQSMLLATWVTLNAVGVVKAWDPYPFILLNLALSFQAAYAAPVIMMSQNRQAGVDRQAAEHDYQVNIKAELEIELLHHKLDQLRQHEVMRLHEAVDDLRELLGHARHNGPGAPTTA